MKEVAKAAIAAGQAAQGHGARASTPAPPTTARRRPTPTAATSASWRSTPSSAPSRSIGYWVVDDVGTVINPLLLKGQIKGGVAQGLGQLLLEDIQFDPDSGQLLTGSFMDYAMPRAHHFCHMEIKSHPTETKANPLGVKGAGEAGCVGAMPAVGNARRRRAVGARHQGHRHAGDAGAHLARDRRGESLSPKHRRLVETRACAARRSAMFARAELCPATASAVHERAQRLRPANAPACPRP